MARLALRPAVPVLASLAALAAGCARPAAPPPPQIRAVIVVDVDTMRADRLGCYGNPAPTSPAFDAFAAQGTRFEWAFAQAPYTLPSQVSILTGLYPQSHGVIHQKDRMAPEATTLAEIFRAAGWRTGGFVDGGYVSAHFGFDQGFEEFFDGKRQGLRASAEKIERWVRANAGGKLFLFVHTYDPHTPYAPPEPFRSRFAALAPEPTPGFEPTSDVLEAIRASQWDPPLRRLGEADLAYARALYDGEIAFVDDWFGRFIALLDELGLSDEAVVAVVSDHGEEFQEHGSVLHEKLYATVTRIPLLMRVPGGVAGNLVAEAVESVDLVPTLVELAGLEIPSGLDGRSLAATLRDGTPPASRLGLSHSPFWGEQRAAFDGRYHLLLTLEDARLELYRYREDPLEQRDLAATEAETAETLARALRRRVAELPRRPAAEAQAELPPEVEESLRALGYLR